jgi:hypothetical protein
MTVRIVSWRVQPIVMSDDGDNLTPINVQAIDIPAKDWDEFKAGGDEAALDSIRQQLNAQ